MGWDYSPLPTGMTRTQHVDSELRRALRGDMIRRTGILPDDCYTGHVWSLHRDEDGRLYGCLTYIDQGAYKFVTTTMGPGDYDAPDWLVLALLADRPTDRRGEYERTWLDRVLADRVPA